MNKLILTLTTVLTFTFRASFVQAADGGDVGEVEQYVDCNAVKANAMHLGLETAELVFEKCIKLKIQECDDEMLASEDLVQAQAQPGDQAELATIFENIYAQNKNCKAKIK